MKYRTPARQYLGQQPQTQQDGIRSLGTPPDRKRRQPRPTLSPAREPASRAERVPSPGSQHGRQTFWSLPLAPWNAPWPRSTSHPATGAAPTVHSSNAAIHEQGSRASREAGGRAGSVAEALTEERFLRSTERDRSHTAPMLWARSSVPWQSVRQVPQRRPYRRTDQVRGILARWSSRWRGPVQRGTGRVPSPRAQLTHRGPVTGNPRPNLQPVTGLESTAAR